MEETFVDSNALVQYKSMIHDILCVCYFGKVSRLESLGVKANRGVQLKNIPNHFSECH